MSLYLILVISSLAIPLILSNDKKVTFCKYWGELIPSLILITFVFAAADIIFTKKGIWGFNPRYLIGCTIAGIPVEEWLFFLAIPYSSIFIHIVFIRYFPGIFLPEKTTGIITLILIAALLAAIILFRTRAYTTFYSAVMIVVLIISISGKDKLLNRFYITFLIILVPFFLVNGILTGSFIEEEVVWYNELEITGFRIFTIPVEDIAYGFSLIMINLLMMKLMRKLLKKNHDIDGMQLG